MDSVVHFEIPVDDVPRAQKFYSKVFGWKMNEMPEMNYTMVTTTEVGDDRMPKERGMINGGMMKRMEMVKSPVVTINVKDIEASVKQVEKNGGKLLVPKQPVGDMGFSAYVKDSEGNVIGLWQLAKEM